MPDSFEPNSNSRSADTAPLVPPSSSEVTIRTMTSDLEAMGKSGGLPGSSPLPAVPLEPFAAAAPRASFEFAQSSAAGTQSQSQAPAAPARTSAHHAVRIVLITVLVGVGALVLFALGFYVIPLLAGK